MQDGSKQGVRKKSDTQEKSYCCLPVPPFVIAGRAFLVSLYSFSSKPGRLKEKEKLEMSSNGMSEGAVKEVPLKPEASAEMLFSALVLDSCLPDNFCQSSFTEDKLDFDSKGV